MKWNNNGRHVGESLQRQCIVISLRILLDQYRAQHIVLLHQKLHGANKEIDSERACQSDVPTDVVKRRVAAQHLIEPVFALRGGERKAIPLTMARADGMKKFSRLKGVVWGGQTPSMPANSSEQPSN